ncbi:MAG: hypothetical protein OYH77_05060 [Pseudomonadota bacterium]|nr:hypothetical protein [Pseudomonadota bacterium]
MKIVCLIAAMSMCIAMFACTDKGNEESKKTPPDETEEQMPDDPDTELPLPVPDQGELAVAVSSKPTNLTIAEQFELIVTIAKGAPIKYRYHLLDAAKGNCSTVAATRRLEQQIGISSEINVSGTGGKTLCVWGVDRDGNEQQSATTLEWERHSPDSEVQVPVEENADAPAPSPTPRGVMKVSNRFHIFDSAHTKVYETKITNIGNAKLHWRIIFEDNADWLGYSFNTDASRVYEAVRKKSIGGELDPAQTKILYLRVKDIYKTDYGMPHTRKVAIRFGNSKSGWTRVGGATLRIPKANIQPTHLDLNRDGSWVRAYINNIGNPEAAYSLQLIRVEGIKNHDYIKVEGPFYESGNRNNVYYKFAQRTDMTPPSAIFVAYAVYTNGDSHNHGDCYYYKVGDKVSNGDGKATIVRYNSNACQTIMLYPDVDDKDS